MNDQPLTNDELYEAAKAAIMALFGDQSVTVDDTIANLNTLIEEIQELIDTL